jgi:hypothetical protein
MLSVAMWQAKAGDLSNKPRKPTEPENKVTITRSCVDQNRLTVAVIDSYKLLIKATGPEIPRMNNEMRQPTPEAIDRQFDCRSAGTKAGDLLNRHQPQASIRQQNRREQPNKKGVDKTNISCRLSESAREIRVLEITQ